MKILKIDAFNDQSLNFYISSIARIKRYAKDNKLNILISSDGGMVNCAYALIDYIAHTGLETTMFCLGRAQSCGALLLCSGQKRYASPNSFIMIHGTQMFLPKIETQYSYSTLKGMLESEAMNDRRFLNFHDKFCKKKKGYFENKLKMTSANALWYTPEEALKENIIDEIGFPPDFADWTDEL